MESTRTLPGRGGGAGRRPACGLALVVSAITLATPALAQEAALGERVGPVRTERLRAAHGDEGVRPYAAAGYAMGSPGYAFGSAGATAGVMPGSLTALALPTQDQAQPRSAWVVAGAALAGSALGWAVGAGGTLVVTHERLGQEDLTPLLYAAIAGVVVSVPAGAVAAHWASRGHGSVLASTLLGYAVAGVAIAAWPDGGWALGPALAIPITVAVETL